MSEDKTELPAIYRFIDEKVTGLHVSFNELSKEMNTKMSVMSEKIAIIDSKDKPSPPCREFIAKFEGECEAKCKIAKSDNDALAVKVHNKVNFSFFWKTVVGIMVICGTAYAYLLNRMDGMSASAKSYEDDRQIEALKK